MNNEEKLERIKRMITELSEDNSPYHKKLVLNNYIILYPFIKNILRIIYSPFTNFYLDGESVLNYIDKNNFMITEPSPDIEDIEELLTSLEQGNISRGKVSLASCSKFIFRNHVYEYEIVCLLNKDLKCGISTKTINSACPGLIPEFNIPKGVKYKKKYCDFEKEEWYLSRKIDGIRCLAFIPFSGNIRFYSSNGKEFFTLNKLKNSLNKAFPKLDYILDGELGVFNKDNSFENFKSITSEIRRKNHTIENPVFYLFDAYPIEVFLNKDQAFTPFENTLNFFESIPKDFLDDHIEILSQYKIKNEKDLNECILRTPKNWEGLILRKNSPSLFKRSKNILKIKDFIEEEYEVKDIEISSKVIEGLETPCVGSLTIVHKEQIVDIGSGLSDKQRVEWCSDPSKIIGKTITVKYFEESYNKEGKVSLRLPTLKHVWDEEKE